MVETKPRFDVSGDQRVNQAIVEREPKSFKPSWPPGMTRGHDTENRRADAEIVHQTDVFGIAVVMIAGDVSRITVGDAPRLAAIGVPDARAAAVLLGGASI